MHREARCVFMLDFLCGPETIDGDTVYLQVISRLAVSWVGHGPAACPCPTEPKPSKGLNPLVEFHFSSSMSLDRFLGALHYRFVGGLYCGRS